MMRKMPRLESLEAGETTTMSLQLVAVALSYKNTLIALIFRTTVKSKYGKQQKRLRTFCLNTGIRLLRYLPWALFSGCHNWPMRTV
jgi:hypothetical protein